MSDIQYANLLHFSLVEYLYAFYQKGLFKIGSTYRYLTEARQFHFLWYLLSKSGQNHSRWLITMIDRQRADV